MHLHPVSQYGTAHPVYVTDPNHHCKIHKYLLHPISCAYATNPLSIESYTNIHKSDALKQYMQCLRHRQIHFPCSPPSLAGVSTKSAQSSKYL